MVRVHFAGELILSSMADSVKRLERYMTYTMERKAAVDKVEEVAGLLRASMNLPKKNERLLNSI